MIYAYIRVSSTDQNEDRQLIAMLKLGIPRKNIYIDKKSGKDFDRPKYVELMTRLKAGDLLYIESIDRLGRNYNEILENWRTLTKEKDVDIVVIDMPILDTRQYKDLLGTFIADLVLQVLSFLAQKERENIHRRQADGIKAARFRGVKFGRPKKPMPDNLTELLTLWEHGKLETAEVLKKCKISRATLYVKLNEHKLINKK